MPAAAPNVVWNWLSRFEDPLSILYITIKINAVERNNLVVLEKNVSSILCNNTGNCFMRILTATHSDGISVVFAVILILLITIVLFL